VERVLHLVRLEHGQSEQLVSRRRREGLVLLGGQRAQAMAGLGGDDDASTAARDDLPKLLEHNRGPALTRRATAWPIDPAPMTTTALLPGAFVSLMSAASSRLALVLLVGDLLEPFDGLPVERLLDRDVRHRRHGRGAVPVLLVRLDADDITGSNLLDRPAPSLVKPAAELDDQRLSERVRVPVAARARLEGHIRAASAPGRARLEQRIDLDVPREVLCRALGRWSCTVSAEFHVISGSVLLADSLSPLAKVATRAQLKHGAA